MKKTLRAVIEKGKVNTLCLPKETSVWEASKQMAERDIGSAMVYDGAEVAGIVTERDFLRRVIAPRLDPESTAIGDVMTHPVVVVPASTTIEAALQFLAKGGFRRLPVEDEGTLLGLVTLTHLSTWVADELDQEVGDLISFIAGPASDRQTSRLHDLTRPTPRRIEVDPDFVEVWQGGVLG